MARRWRWCHRNPIIGPGAALLQRAPTRSDGDGVGAAANPSGRGRPSYNKHRPAAMPMELVPPRTYRAGGGPPTTSTDPQRWRRDWCHREPIGPGAALLQTPIPAQE